ncbi:MAG TPA: penicillin-insensitive murein endopeptidase, partial [Pyrinomonadaceae bacterium]
LVAAVLGVVFLGALGALVFAVRAERRAEGAQERVEAARQKLQKSRNALTHIQSYEMEMAERELNEFYRLTGDDVEGHENRAWVLYNLGDLNGRLERHDRAAAFFESALQTEVMTRGRLGPDSVGTLDSLAHALEDERNYAAAAMRYEQLAALVDGVAASKGRYYRLNAANVHVDLAELYVALAESDGGGGGAAAPPDRRDARAKAEPHYRAAVAIWEDVLRDDPEALSDQYVRAAAFFAGKLGDGKAAADFVARAGQLRRNTGTPTARRPIGPPNPGGDPEILAQLAPDGPGYVLFGRDASQAFGRAEFVELLRNVAGQWAARHPGQKFVVADMSLRGGGPFPGHGGDHQDGREADIWPLTNNGAAEPTNIYAPNYSRELTRELIELIHRTSPAAVVYFDDPELVSAGLVRATLDHNNHMHVLLP